MRDFWRQKNTYKHRHQLILQYILPPLFRSLFVLSYFFSISFLCFYSPQPHAPLTLQMLLLCLCSLLPAFSLALLALSFFKSPFRFLSVCRKNKRALAMPAQTLHIDRFVKYVIIQRAKAGSNSLFFHCFAFCF